MPRLVNPSADDLNAPLFGLSVPAGGSAEVSDEVASAFADHPVLRVEADVAPAPASEPEPAPLAVETVTVEVPAGEHVEVLPDVPAPPA